MALVGYLTGSDQECIGAFRVADEQAFRPVALETKPAFGQYVPVTGGNSDLRNRGGPSM
jgi:hypothetical protein